MIPDRSLPEKLIDRPEALKFILEAHQKVLEAFDEIDQELKQHE
jgi:hypothetical protein